MKTREPEKELYRADILRARKAALSKTNADLLSEDVRTEATVGKVLRGGANVDLKTLGSIAGSLGVELHQLFVFETEENIEVAGG